MNQKLWTKVLASLLVMTLTLANFILLGVYASDTYATSDDLENQITVTNDENVTFDAYFKDKEGKATHTTRESMSKEDLKLYVSVQVKKGYLKNAKVQVLGENNTNSNLQLKESNEDLEYIESIDEATNTINLKQVNTATQVILELPVVAVKNDIYDISNFSKLNNMVLTGTYIDDEGKEVAIEKTIQTRNEWKEDITPVLEQQVVRFIPYQVSSKTGTILQTLVRSGIENNALPIEETTITLTAPMVNGKNPISVTVTPNGTLATNGQDKESFSGENFTYDAETGIITISLKNEALENKVSWLKDIKDEFIVTYIYDEKVDTLQAVQTASVEIKAYNSVETKVSTNNELPISINEVLGQIVTANIEVTESLSKGYLYTKSEKETSYEEKVTIDIAYPELVDSISVKQDTGYFVNEAGETSPLTVGDKNYAYYKTTKISKANFEKILGTDGSIKLLTLAGEELVTFNKDTVADENGDYVFNYEGQINQIKIETTKPVATGKLELTHIKSLKGNTDYSKAQVESFKTLKVVASIEAFAENTIIVNEEASKEITLIAPATKIETSVSNANLSTVVTNENVELRVILKTNDISCDLYKNPTVEIVLPNYISKLNIKDVNLLFDNELKIKDYNTYVNESGNIVIKVNIEGEQTKFNSDEISKGANLIINTDITLKQLTPTRDDVMKVYVTNELATTYEQTENSNARTVEQKGYTQTGLKAVAPIGMVTTNTISNYNEKNETVTSMSSQEQTGKLDVGKDAKTAKVSMNVINNYQNIVNNMVVLGRIPTTGSKNVDTNEDFSSNLELKIASGITVTGIDASNVEVYYSTNINATKDLSLAANSWTKIPENMANVKSYLIIVNGDIATGTTLGFEYDLSIPEKLTYNMGAYANYVVYFDNVKTEGTTSEKAVATKVGLETGDGPELEVSVKADIENGAEVEEGKLVKYTVSVKNIGKSDLKNVKVSGNIPYKSIYAYYVNSGMNSSMEESYDNELTQYSENIETLLVGETKQVEYLVKVQDLKISTELKKDENGNIVLTPEGEPIREEVIEDASLIVKGQATVEGYDAAFSSNEISNKVVQGYIDLKMEVVHIPASYPRREDDEVIYEIMIQNINSVEKHGLVLTNDLPEGLIFKEADNGGVYDEAKNQVIWNIGTLGALEQKHFYLYAQTDKLPENEVEKAITNKVILKTSEKEMVSNEETITVQKAKITVTQTSETNSKVSEGDTIKYNVTVKNEGTGNAEDVTITDIIPEGLRFESAQYNIQGENNNVQTGVGNGVIALAVLPGNTTVNITIELVAEDLPEGTTSKEVTNVVKVEASKISEVLSNSVTHTVVEKKNADVNDPSTDGNVPVDGTYSISGIAWLDSNQDGKRDDDETRMANIPVILINAENGQIVTDITTGKDKKQETGSKGEYEFTNLLSGNYMVVFLYDTGNYGVTIYKQAGINDDKNSDTVQMNVVYEDTKRVAGVSDKLQVVNQNITNIDLGLVTATKFDLKLDKVISKITVSDAKGTNVHEYADEQVAKLDLNSKTANGSTIIIEYKIRVTNEGGLAGYAKKIVDYMPSDMKFNSELNGDWYIGANGTDLYNASLANTLILPGETKEVTLLLTKKITDSNMGIINNTAEILESYNDLGLEDIDSTPANKVQNEDDYSCADAIIGIKTGEVYVYILITLSTIALFGVGIYLINKKVLRRI